MARRRVDLPDPLRPISAMASPSRATNETPRTAWTRRYTSPRPCPRSSLRAETAAEDEPPCAMTL